MVTILMSPSERERPSMKIAHIRLKIDVFEGFAIDYNLTVHTLIGYGQKYIAQWEINTKRKHKRAKDHLHDTHSFRILSICEKKRNVCI